MHLSLVNCFLLLGTLHLAVGWGGDELEVFDVVEEVNQNFYTLLGLSRDAEGSSIKKAFRKLSLVLHPDKNDSPDAEVQFRQLVSVYDILKDPNKRKLYDNVLDNGLPDWKHAMYYYRRVRKMGLREMAVILFVIITIGQYLYGWANYIEKKLTIDDYLSTKTKKSQKKLKKGKTDTTAQLLEEIDSVLVKPSIKDTLPCQIPRLFWFLFVSGPPLLYQTLCDYWRERQIRKQQEMEQQEESEEEVEVVQRAPRKRKTFVLPELKDDPSSQPSKSTNQPRPAAPPVISGGLWTDDDLLDLAKLVKKYPVGTTERWDKIGEAMNRPANEVAHMAHKLKDDVLKNLAQKSEKEENDLDEEGGNEPMIIEEQPKKKKTRGGKVGEVGENNVGNWSQVQQKALEVALSKFPKGATSDRWEKIAKCVPEKTKEECMIRYKYLVDMLKKKKEQDEADTGSQDQEDQDQGLQREENDSLETNLNSDNIQQNSDSIT